MVSTTDVIHAYRLILGREPESKDVVEQMAQTFASVRELRSAFFSSKEFRRSQREVPASITRPMHWRRNRVDVDVPAADFDAMLRHVEETWRALGDSEPFFSVLTHEKYRSENLEKNKAAFYESGKVVIVNFRAALDRAGLELSSFSTCVEFGCGTGRLTIWLAAQFATVIGLDISQPHLDAAKLALEERGIGNASLVLTNSIEAIERLPPFDVFFSVIVLQHNPPPVAMHILDRVLDRLNPGGIAYFQIPTYQVGYAFDAAAYLAAAAESKGRPMEMHVVPQKDLLALFARRGCNVLEVREDDWTGSAQFVSNTFLIQKRDKQADPEG